MKEKLSLTSQEVETFIKIDNKRFAALKKRSPYGNDYFRVFVYLFENGEEESFVKAMGIDFKVIIKYCDPKLFSYFEGDFFYSHLAQINFIAPEKLLDLYLEENHSTFNLNLCGEYHHHEECLVAIADTWQPGDWIMALSRIQEGEWRVKANHYKVSE